ncbi:hypothetical protein U9M48_004897 [Paspalum notatum var. saurae]|uniref:Leucine-rich repeat-containing N-terminal plant-type domain-containing protein n=1 Tax=Paspalum notatum var. saurae TaxID=547442 RepID=A0AAQ3PU78_PASNO
MSSCFPKGINKEENKQVPRRRIHPAEKSLSAVTSNSSASGNETDRLSLLDFKKPMPITLDPQQHALASWNDSTHFCSWEGVLCTLTSPRPAHQRNPLVAWPPPAAPDLRYPFLSNNTLQGRIPSFTDCSSLRVLWLHRNGLVGQFPEELPLGLRLLQISVNSLSGTIPTSLSNITTLTVISCAYNDLVGNIPDEFSALSNIQQLYTGRHEPLCSH